MNIKEMTMLHQNTVVTLHRNGEVFKLYLKPGLYLEAHIAPYFNQGWRVYSVEMCTLEAYLNYRVDDVVDNLNSIATERKRMQNQLHLGDLSLEDYLTALTVTHELEVSDLRKLYRLMNRIARSGCKCRNEEAHMIYSMVF